MEPLTPRTPEEVSRETFRWDRWQGAARGFLEVTWQPLALVVAIRYFEASEGEKSLIAAGPGIGMVLGLWLIPALVRLPLSLSALISRMWLGTAVCLLFLSFAPTLGLFIAAAVAAQVINVQTLQLGTQLYATNYRASERGRRLSLIFVIAASCGIAFAHGAGALLDWRLEWYGAVFVAAAAACFLAAHASGRIPSGALRELKGGSLRENLSLLWTDRLFGTLIVGWSFMGLGNLMMIPVRVEYLANPTFGVNANNVVIALILNGVTNGVRLASTVAWGRLFDQFNLVYVRMGVNVLFVASIAVFFASGSIWLMGLGSALFGVASGGATSYGRCG